MRSRVLLAGLALSLASLACTDTPVELDEVEVAADDPTDGKADVAAELRVRTGETTLWMTRTLERRDGVDGARYVLRGRTSRNLVGGSAFVFDDPYGDLVVRSPRSFEVTWPVSTARTLLDGVNQFVGLDLVPSAGRPDHLTARVSVRPRLAPPTGSARIYLTAELTPVVVGGSVVYRLAGRTTTPVTSLQVSVGGVDVPDLHRRDATRFEVDLGLDHVVAIAGGRGAAAEIVVTAGQGAGAPAVKRARLGLSVKRLGLTSGDAYDLWPSPVCDADTRACLAALPDGAVDLGACGEAVVVRACASAAGFVVDDVAVQAALADGAARTGSIEFRTDAVGLVGADRAEAFQGGTEQVIEARVVALFGQRYATAAARAAALTAALDAAIDAAYARPLELVEPHPPMPGELARARQVAADALLAELARFDFESSEYARPLEVLTRSFRARHVASIRELRETLPLAPSGVNPAWDVFAGRWLDPYIEVSIDRATGAATTVLIEID